MLNKTQFLSAANAVFIAQVYEKFLSNPASVSKEWADFFTSLSDGDRQSFEADFFGPSWKKRDLSVINSEVVAASAPKADKYPQKQELTQAGGISKEIIRNLYIKYGHISAKLDPIWNKTEPKHPELTQGCAQYSGNDIAAFENLYCSTIGVEFDHISNPQEKSWLIEKFESAAGKLLSKEEQKRILQDVMHAELFEQFIHKKFPGMKRFSIEGGEAAMAAINTIISNAAGNKVSDVIIGMAHRGRLGMLTQVAGKPYNVLFSEFHKTIKPSANIGEISSDVKYHAGYKSSRNVDGNNINVQIAFNPSHLEAVNPVVMGVSYAISKMQNQSAMPILIHGDAAMIGQGVVAECFNMSNLAGYNTNGVVHIVVNNQIGFTAESCDSRSSRYATDIAKILECPIIHVNGEDVESVVKISELLGEYRNTFKKDVVLDIVCYRKYGHNEGDEPFYTNPAMYNALKAKISTPSIYAEKLVKNSVISTEELNKLKESYINILDAAYDLALEKGAILDRELGKEFDGLDYKVDTIAGVKTGINQEAVMNLVEKFCKIPADFTANPRLAKQIEGRWEVIQREKKLDWAAAEMLAFASLLQDGSSVRLSGQDAERGTFSHRHSVLSDSVTGRKYNILSGIESKNAQYIVHNSPLSEYAVLGFEYGISLVQPKDLVIWEAQFGDFANGASTVFHQFISSAEKKWLLMSGLVMLLPHGFEGQGPEHSSARLEGYLQSCAQDNIIVANCTTPANLFHILRRQVKAKYRKPLIIMSPKSLLRHKLVVSDLNDFSENSGFKPIISDDLEDCKAIRKVVVTSGKLYYDLLEYRTENKINDVAIVRIEQYYPFASEIFEVELLKYSNAKSVIFAQEEPKNMGSWSFIRDYIEESMEKVGIKSKLEYIGRSASASPATGFEKVHKKEQESVITGAFK